MKTTWTDNFHAQINQTQDNVRTLRKDCDMINKIADNIVVRAEITTILKQLDKTVNIDQFYTL